MVFLGALLAAAAVYVPVSSAGAVDATDRILFHRATDSGASTYAINSDGSDLTLIGSGEDPAWSPDGSRIVVADYDGISDNIYVMNSDGNDRRRLTSSSEYTDLDPAWSPDGERITFIRRDRVCCFDDSHRSSVWVMGVDGSDPRPLTDGPEGTWDSWPSWSPDGRSVAFQRTDFREVEGNSGLYNVPEIWVVDLDTGTASSLTSGSRHSMDSHPDWSVDDRITFASNRGEFVGSGSGDGEASALYRMNADRGADVIRLTDGEADDFAASWSPDLEMVSFVRDPDGSPHVRCSGGDLGSCSDADAGVGELPGTIHVMNADGSGTRALTSPPDGAYDMSPTFRPDPTRVPAEGRGAEQQPAPSTETRSGTPTGSGAGTEPEADDPDPESAELLNRSEASRVADRAPTVQGVGVAGDPDDRASADQGAPGGWVAALVGGGLLGGVALMGALGRRRLRRS